MLEKGIPKSCMIISKNVALYLYLCEKLLIQKLFTGMAKQFITSFCKYMTSFLDEYTIWIVNIYWGGGNYMYLISGFSVVFYILGWFLVIG